MTYFIGIDPGLSTGIAVFRNSGLVDVFQGERSEALRFLRYYEGHRPSSESAYVGCERYTHTTQRVYTHQPDTPQLIGAVQYLYSDTSVEIHMQSPSDARRVMTDRRIRSLGLWITPKKVEQADADDVRMAVRHALLCMLRIDPVCLHKLLNPVNRVTISQ